MNPQNLDIQIAAFYLIAIGVVGIAFSRKQAKSQVGYFLGGRSLTWPMLGCSLFATHISSLQFVGQSGFSYQIGIAAANPQLLGAFALGISAVFFIPIYLKNEMYNVPKYLELRFDRKIKLYYCGAIALTTLLNGPIALYAASLVSLELLGMSNSYLPFACYLIAATVGAYSIVGGMKSIVVTDTIQTALLIFGGIAVLFLGMREIGGWDALTASVGETHLELLLPASHDIMPWTVVLSGMMWGSICWASSNSALLQRALGAKDLEQARLGMIFCASLKLLAIFIIAFPGIIAAVIYKDIQPDTAYVRLVSDLLPIGLSGLVLAGLLAALMSSADSSMMNISSIVAIEMWPRSSAVSCERNRIRIGRTIGMLHLGTAALIAPFVGELGLIFPLVLKTTGYLLAPLGTLFVLSRFIKRINRQGAYTVMFLGAFIGLYSLLITTVPALKQFAPTTLIDNSFFVIQAYLTLIYAFSAILVSFLTPKPPPDSVIFLNRSPSEKLSGRWGIFRICYSVTLLAILSFYVLF